MQRVNSYKKPFHRQIHELEDWMIPRLKEHMAEGWSFRYFAGRFGIAPDSWDKIVRATPELFEIRENYNEYIHNKRRNA